MELRVNLSDKAAMAGKAVSYMTGEDIQYMGGKPHYFPQVGKVDRVMTEGLIVDGKFVSNEDFLDLRVIEA